VVSGFLLGQATPKPVPEEWLRDGKLVVPEFNFNVNSPSPQSRWTYTEMNTRGKSSTAFYAATSDVDQFIVFASEAGGGIDRQQYLDGYVGGLRQSFPKNWNIEDTNYYESDFPETGSTRFLVKIRSKNGTTIFLHGYVVWSSHTWVLAQYSAEIIQSAEFKSFVRSFARLGPETGEPIQSMTSSIVGLSIGLLAILGIWGAVVDNRYVKSGGRRDLKTNLFSMAAIIVAGASAGAYQAFYGERFSVQQDLMLAFGVWELSRWLIRQKYPVNSLPSPSNGP
jgi:hypothetical protein